MYWLYVISVVSCTYSCWLSEAEGTIWAFVAPMLLIIVVSSAEYMQRCGGSLYIITPVATLHK